MNRILPGCLLILCLSSVACEQHSDTAVSDASWSVKPEWGVVLPEEEAMKLLVPASRSKASDLSRYWAPGRSEIERLEARLPDVLGTTLGRVILESGRTLPQPSDYYRQYGGFHRRGRRVIYVNGLHYQIVDQPGQDRGMWTRNALSMWDGGLNTFGVVYDVERDTFGRVEFSSSYAGEVPMRWF